MAINKLKNNRSRGEEYINAEVLKYGGIGILTKILGDYQGGFKHNRPTTEQTFILRQIVEKFFEYSIDFHCLFIDFKKAFDSISSSKIEQILKICGIPEKLIKLEIMTLSKKLEINSGVRQGDAFNLVLNSVIQDVNSECTILNKNIQLTVTGE
ncbi:uncharacterized protein LOC129616024 [Condylostylus longicornis]|uniref:uncharacterized protein LOC129616024 n=1 Tax=Condylostylus longicornis TaxID=2530218 RepID=UPI00244DB375|nr:uncharacterized protein LOC129616024 [Condylostylus longicornis]